MPRLDIATNINLRRKRENSPSPLSPLNKGRITIVLHNEIIIMTYLTIISKSLSLNVKQKRNILINWIMIYEWWLISERTYKMAILDFNKEIIILLNNKIFHLYLCFSLSINNSRSKLYFYDYVISGLLSQNLKGNRNNYEIK